MAIQFNFDSYKKPAFFKANTIKAWLRTVAAKEKQLIQDLNYVFMGDEELLKINMDYLQHNTYTDIITFDHSERKGYIESDIFISMERVEFNAKKFNTSFEDELHRVMAHGLLHLCGYKDKKREEVEMMRKKEEACLRLIKQ